MPRSHKRGFSEPLPPPRPYEGVRAAAVRVSRGRLVVDLTDGRTLITPLSLIPGFDLLPRRALDGHRIIGGGIGIHFPAIDEDVSVTNLLHPELTMRPAILPRLVTEAATSRRRHAAKR